MSPNDAMVNYLFNGESFGPNLDFRFLSMKVLHCFKGIVNSWIFLCNCIIDFTKSPTRIHLLSSLA